MVEEMKDYFSKSSVSKSDIANLKKKEAANSMADINKRKKEVAVKMKKVMEDAKKKSSGFKKEVLNKFKKNTVGIIVMPPKPKKNLETKAGDLEDSVDILVLMKYDGISDAKKKLSKKKEVEKKIKKIAKRKMKNISVNVALVTELWQMCLKGKYDILNIIATGMPVYDSGWLGALRATEIHKMKVLKKFEKYVISYVLAGSMVRGDATDTSDVDTFVVIDDTDVTRMTSAELKARLQGIILGYAQEAAMAAGVDNKLNIQVYVLSNMWDSIKNANPVIFTFLRDGIPLYDRGMFSPWKMLLKKGKIKPTPEAISQYMKSGDKMVKRIKQKMRNIAIEDFFWATCTPAQGALMTAGLAPPTHKELAGSLRDAFVKKGMLEEKYVKMWERIFSVRKDFEHGKRKQISAKEVSNLLKDVESFLKRLKKLFRGLEKQKISEGIKELHNKSIDDSLAALAMFGVKASKKNYLTKVKESLINKQIVPENYYDLLKRIKKLEQKKGISRESIASLDFEHNKMSEDVFNKIKAEKGKKIDKYKLSAKYDGNEKTAAIWLFTNEAYIIVDVNKPNTSIIKYKLTEEGKLEGGTKAKLEDVDKKLQTFSGTPTTLTKRTIESLKEILSDDFKIVVGA